MKKKLISIFILALSVVLYLTPTSVDAQEQIGVTQTNLSRTKSFNFSSVPPKRYRGLRRTSYVYVSKGNYYVGYYR